MTRYWTCRRQKEGRICGKRNRAIKQKCERCQGPRPRRTKAKHLVALETTYDAYVTLNGGDRCGICLRERSQRDRHLDRDHDHRSGRPRGLLCHRCNRALPHWMTPEWLEAAATYLRAAA